MDVFFLHFQSNWFERESMNWKVVLIEYTELGAVGSIRSEKFLPKTKLRTTSILWPRFEFQQPFCLTILIKFDWNSGYEIEEYFVVSYKGEISSLERNLINNAFDLFWRKKN